MPKHWAGGNVNKLLSMCFEKVAFIELREQENRADSADVGRSITTYLMSYLDYSSTYLKEGVRRIAQTWVESRKMHKDLDSWEFQAAWEKIRKAGFEHAFESCAKMASQATALGFTEDATKMEDNLAKLHEVFENPTEQLHSY